VRATTLHAFHSPAPAIPSPPRRVHASLESGTRAPGFHVLLGSARVGLGAGSAVGLPPGPSHPDLEGRGPEGAQALLALPVCSVVDWTEVYRGLCAGSDTAEAATGALLLLLHRLSAPVHISTAHAGRIAAALEARQAHVYAAADPGSGRVVLMTAPPQLGGDEPSSPSASPSSSPSSSSSSSGDDQSALRLRIADARYNLPACTLTTQAAASLLSPPSVAVILSRGTPSYATASTAASAVPLTAGGILLALDLLVGAALPAVHKALGCGGTGAGLLAGVAWPWLVRGLASALPFLQPACATRWLALVLAAEGWVGWLKVAASVLAASQPDLAGLESPADVRNYLTTFPRRAILTPKRLVAAMGGLTSERAAAALVLACAYRPRDANSAGVHESAALIYGAAVAASGTPNQAQPSALVKQLVGRFGQAFGIRRAPGVGPLPQRPPPANAAFLAGAAAFAPGDTPHPAPYVCAPLPAPPRIHVVSSASGVASVFARHGGHGGRGPQAAGTAAPAVMPMFMSVPPSAVASSRRPSGAGPSLAAGEGAGVPPPPPGEPHEAVDRTEVVVPAPRKHSSASPAAAAAAHPASVGNPTLASIAGGVASGAVGGGSSGGVPLPAFLSSPDGGRGAGPGPSSSSAAAPKSAGANSGGRAQVSRRAAAAASLAAVGLTGLGRNEIPLVPSSVPGVSVPDAAAIVRLVCAKAAARGEASEHAHDRWRMLSSSAPSLAAAVGGGKGAGSSNPPSGVPSPDGHADADDPAITAARKASYVVEAWRSVAETGQRTRRASLTGAGGAVAKGGHVAAETDAALSALVADSMRVLRMCKLEGASGRARKAAGAGSGGLIASIGRLVDAAVEAKYGSGMGGGGAGGAPSPHVDAGISDAAKQRMRSLLLPRGMPVGDGLPTSQGSPGPAGGNGVTIFGTLAAAAASAAAAQTGVSPTKAFADLLLHLDDSEDPLAALLAATEGAVVPGPGRLSHEFAGGASLPAPDAGTPGEQQQGAPSGTLASSAAAPLVRGPLPAPGALAAAVAGLPLPLLLLHKQQMQGSYGPSGRAAPSSPDSTAVETKLGSIFASLVVDGEGGSSAAGGALAAHSASAGGLALSATARARMAEGVSAGGGLGASLATLPPVTSHLPTLEETNPVAAAMVRDAVANDIWAGRGAAAAGSSATPGSSSAASLFDEAILSEYPFLHARRGPGGASEVAAVLSPSVAAVAAQLREEDSALESATTRTTPRRAPPRAPGAASSPSLSRAFGGMSPADPESATQSGILAGGALALYLTGEGGEAAAAARTAAAPASSVPRYLSRDFSISRVAIGSPLSALLGPAAAAAAEETGKLASSPDEAASAGAGKEDVRPPQQAGTGSKGVLSGTPTPSRAPPPTPGTARAPAASSFASPLPVSASTPRVPLASSLSIRGGGGNAAAAATAPPPPQSPRVSVSAVMEETPRPVLHMPHAESASDAPTTEVTGASSSDGVASSSSTPRDATRVPSSAARGGSSSSSSSSSAASSGGGIRTTANLLKQRVADLGTKGSPREPSEGSSSKGGLTSPSLSSTAEGRDAVKRLNRVTAQFMTGMM
jgi:hypothetical protein